MPTKTARDLFPTDSSLWHQCWTHIGAHEETQLPRYSTRVIFSLVLTALVLREENTIVEKEHTVCWQQKAKGNDCICAEGKGMMTANAQNVPTEESWR